MLRAMYARLNFLVNSHPWRLPVVSIVVIAVIVIFPPVLAEYSILASLFILVFAAEIVSRNTEPIGLSRLAVAPDATVAEFYQNHKRAALWMLFVGLMLAIALWPECKALTIVERIFAVPLFATITWLLWRQASDKRPALRICSTGIQFNNHVDSGDFFLPWEKVKSVALVCSFGGAVPILIVAIEIGPEARAALLPQWLRKFIEFQRLPGAKPPSTINLTVNGLHTTASEIMSNFKRFAPPSVDVQWAPSTYKP